jgi:hypothetical protein
LTIATSSRYRSDKRKQIILDMLSAPDRPTAVLAMFDGLALAVLPEAERMGLSAPHDLGVIGFDNIASAALACPGLRVILVFEVFAVVVALGGTQLPVLMSETYNWQFALQDREVAAAYAVVILAISILFTILILRLLHVPKKART